MLSLSVWCRNAQLWHRGSITSGSTGPAVGSGELFSPQLQWVFSCAFLWSCCTGRALESPEKQPGGQLEPLLPKENKEPELRFLHSICAEVRRKANRIPGWSCYPSLFHLSLPRYLPSVLSELFISCFIPEFVQLYPNYRLLK